MKIVLLILAASLSLTHVASEVARPTLGAAKWTAHMMGVDSDDALRAVRTAVKGKTVTVAIANSAQSTTPGQYRHDDYMALEMNAIARYLGLSMTIVRIPPQDLGTAYEAAVRVGDIVVDYRSYWDAPRVAQATSVIAAHPNKLFILPYGEINGNACPPTSTSLQGHALHADGTGCTNLITTIPLAFGQGGRLMRPQRRTAQDTSTVTFVAPTAWAHTIGTTCPSAATASIAAACLLAAADGKLTAGQLVKLLAEGAGHPRPSPDAEFDVAVLAELKVHLADLMKTDALGRRMLLHDKVLNLTGALNLLTSGSARKQAPSAREDTGE